MRTRQPAALDVRSILQAAHDARREAPDLFGLWLAQAFADPDGDAWHQPAKEGAWRHHASALSQCVRRSVFERDPALEAEGFSVESLSTFEIGKWFHVLVQFGLAVHPDYELLLHELGGAMSVDGTLLVALADAVYRHAGELHIIDVKTESTYAPKMRRKEAKEAERSHDAKPDHVLQLTATAMVVEKFYGLTADHGWIVYINKENGDLDPQPVPFRDRDTVVRMVAVRESHWARYTALRTLPGVIEGFPDKRLCQPRSESDQRGKYCPYRMVCVERFTVEAKA